MRDISIKQFSENDIQKLVRLRPGETRVGETIVLSSAFDSLSDALEKFEGRFVLFGIPEDLGPRANFGRPGAHTAFADFLVNFLNMQDNRFLSGSQVMLLGQADTKALMKKAAEIDPQKNTGQLRQLVAAVDELVYPVIKKIIAAGKIPIVIGGGHNNAYGMLKGAYLGRGKQSMGTVNIDPHADIRPLEGRHSGNGFSYAIADGYLDRYFAIGLHQNYNSEYIWETLDSDPELFGYITYEDILDRKVKTGQVIAAAVKFMKKLPFGIEIDIDSIQYAECSAKTPVGFRPDKVRNLVKGLCSQGNILYLNISEGIAVNDNQTGKLTAYLVSEFIRAMNK